MCISFAVILFVILGIRTFYDEPDDPGYSARPIYPTRVDVPPQPGTGEPLYCDLDRCFKGGRELTAEDEAELTEEERLYVQEERLFQEQRRGYGRAGGLSP